MMYRALKTAALPVIVLHLQGKNNIPRAVCRTAQQGLSRSVREAHRVGLPRCAGGRRQQRLGAVAVAPDRPGRRPPCNERDVQFCLNRHLRC